MSEYNDDLKIDFDNLNINWRDQPITYMKWSEKWANAVVFKDRKKETIDVLKADLDAKYRHQLERTIGKKPTETMVSAAITADNEYKLAQQDLIEATKNVNLLAAAKAAFEHRKKALEGLTQLWLGGYYSNPNIPAEIKERVKKDSSAYRNEQTTALNNNKRMQERKIKPIKKKI
jgi:hypothetical protein